MTRSAGSGETATSAHESPEHIPVQETRVMVCLGAGLLFYRA